jgi:hypothetical protein
MVGFLWMRMKVIMCGRRSRNAGVGMPNAEVVGSRNAKCGMENSEYQWTIREGYHLISKGYEITGRRVSNISRRRTC